MPDHRQTVLTKLIQFLTIVNSLVLIFWNLNDLALTIFYDDMKNMLLNYPNLTCSLSSPELGFVLTCYCYFAIISLKLVASMFPTFFINMNHDKASKLIVYAILFCWTNEYIFVISYYKTICSKLHINFLSKLFFIDKGNFYEKPALLAFHIALMIIPQMLKILMKIIERIRVKNRIVPYNYQIKFHKTMAQNYDPEIVAVDDHEKKEILNEPLSDLKNKISELEGEDEGEIKCTHRQKEFNKIERLEQFTPKVHQIFVQPTNYAQSISQPNYVSNDTASTSVNDTLENDNSSSEYLNEDLSHVKINLQTTRGSRNSLNKPQILDTDAIIFGCFIVLIIIGITLIAMSKNTGRTPSLGRNGIFLFYVFPIYWILKHQKIHDFIQRRLKRNVGYSNID